MTKTERVLTLAATLISCAAAVWMVPEVRCFAGLDGGGTCARAEETLPLTARPESRLAMKFVPTQDHRVTDIRDIYRSIEQRQEHADPATVPYASRSVPAATLTVYRLASGVDKIRLRRGTAHGQMSLLFYYSGGRLVFVHQVGGFSPDRGDAEQRFYFAEGGMIRWLAPLGEPIDQHAQEFGRNSAYLARLGAELLSHARAVGPPGG